MVISMQKQVKDFIILGHQEFDKVIDGRRIKIYLYEITHKETNYRLLLDTSDSLEAFLCLLDYHSSTVLKYIGNKESVMFFIK